MPIPAIIGAIGGALVGILKLFEEPLLAWLLVLLVLLGDAGLTDTIFGAGARGIVGEFVTIVMNTLGIPIIVTSFQLLVIIGLMPLIVFALGKSVSH